MPGCPMKLDSSTARALPGCPMILDGSTAMAYCACGKCKWGYYEYFFSPIIALSFLSLSSLGDGSICIKILSQRVVKPATTNRPI